MTAEMTVHKLNIDNKTYTVDTLETLPKTLDPFNIFTIKPVGENMLAFILSLSLISNVHPAVFKTPNGIVYKHSEQHLHHNKALSCLEMRKLTIKSCWLRLNVAFLSVTFLGNCAIF